jgi:hypothetical protein
MKGLNFFFICLCISCTLIFSSCTKNSPPAISSPALVTNPWAIDYFYNNQDLTSNFGNARLLFSDSGVVGYDRNGSVVAGAWTQTDNVVTIHFDSQDSTIQSLNHVWVILDKYGDKLVMGDGGAQMRLKVQ